MSAIKCPECGKEVSSLAKQCVHCGCTLTICPECQNVLVGEHECCPKCGYTFKKQVTVQTVSESNEVDSDPIEQWKSAYPFCGLLLKYSKAIKLAFRSISVALMIWAVITFTDWTNLDILNRVFKASSTKDTVTELAIYATIVSIISFLFSKIQDTTIKLSCSKWLKAYNIDGVSYIKKHAEDTPDKQSTKNYNLLRKAALIADKPSNKKYILINLILGSILRVTECICICILALDNIDGAIAAGSVGANFKFQTGALVPAIVAIVLAIIVEASTEIAFDKKMNDFYLKI